MPDKQEEKYEQFLQLFRANEERIYRFILTMLPNFSYADDIMQDTMLVMWKKFDQYHPGTSFVAWGMQIARFTIYKFYRRHESSVVVHFSSDAIDNLLKHQMIFEQQDNPYLDALQNCLERMQDYSKDLISMRYADNMKITDIARKIGKSLQATYKIMSRIHQTLQGCVKHSLKTNDLQ